MADYRTENQDSGKLQPKYGLIFIIISPYYASVIKLSQYFNIIVILKAYKPKFYCLIRSFSHVEKNLLYYLHASS